MQLADIPSEILGQIGTVQQVMLPRQGHTSTVAVLETADQRYVIKKQSTNSTMHGCLMNMPQCSFFKEQESLFRKRIHFT